MMSERTTRPPGDALRLCDARAAVVDAYYDFADAVVRMPRPGTGADQPPAQVKRRLRELSTLEEGLRRSARLFARAAGLSLPAGPEPATPGGAAPRGWLSMLLERLDDLRTVRDTGLTQEQARKLHRLKQILDEETGRR